jgi:predicted nucleic acid-binding protein
MIKQDIFVDSGAWLALAHDRDQHHARASHIYPQLLAKSRRLITTNLVVAECHSLLLKYKGRGVALLFLQTLNQSPRIEQIHSAADLEADAVKILQRFEDQDFSFTDAVSFALMKRRGIRAAFAFDRHFAAAGFTLVPASG